MRRIGPCKILATYGSNAYKVELPLDLALSLVFNVQDLVQFKGPIAMLDGPNLEGETTLSNIPVPPISKPRVEQILDSRVKKQMRHDVYIKLLIKWHNLPEVEATLVVESDFKRVGIDVALLPPGGT